jgi:ribonucleoside-diphosphate reductase alpha chain
MKERGKYSRKLVKEISDNGSSVQNLDWLTDHEKLVFKTAFEINQEVIIRYASQRQRHNCQGQSLNLFVSADESEGYIAHLHRLILEDEYLNGAYYLRSQSGVSASSGCVACQ